MKELIKIEKKLIGAEETNSVNARELHMALEIKKDFSNWIKTQIQRAGLEKNIDYAMVTDETTGGRPQQNYIITTDASKHIAMMSQGQKAKDVRDYFIACEKELKAKEFPHANIDMPELMKTLQMFMQNVTEILTKQSEAITSLAKTVEELANPDRKIREQRIERMQLVFIEQKKSDNEPLSTRQRDAVRENVNIRARELQNFHNMDTAKVSQIIFSELNKKFGTKSYGHIKQKDYVEASLFIKTIELFNF